MRLSFFSIELILKTIYLLNKMQVARNFSFSFNTAQLAAIIVNIIKSTLHIFKQQNVH